MESYWEWVAVESFPVRAKCPLCQRPGDGEWLSWPQKGEYIQVYKPSESEVGPVRIEQWTCWGCADCLHQEVEGKLHEKVVPYIFFRVLRST